METSGLPREVRIQQVIVAFTVFRNVIRKKYAHSRDRIIVFEFKQTGRRGR